MRHLLLTATATARRPRVGPACSRQAAGTSAACPGGPAADALLAPTSTTSAGPAGITAGASRAAGQCHFCPCACEFVRHGPSRRRVIHSLRITTGIR